jgi:hypothetical protein
VQITLIPLKVFLESQSKHHMLQFNAEARLRENNAQYDHLKGALFLALPPLLEQDFLSCSLVITGPNWT